jgi:hypothetical protein
MEGEETGAGHSIRSFIKDIDSLSGSDASIFTVGEKFLLPFGEGMEAHPTIRGGDAKKWPLLPGVSSGLGGEGDF